ncbi:hypothetical protein L9F63_016016, partial [Diploptera punctata]
SFSSEIAFLSRIALYELRKKFTSEGDVTIVNATSEPISALEVKQLENKNTVSLASCVDTPAEQDEMSHD